jgi:hypothetical protein
LGWIACSCAPQNENPARAIKRSKGGVSGTLRRSPPNLFCYEGSAWPTHQRARGSLSAFASPLSLNESPGPQSRGFSSGKADRVGAPDCAHGSGDCFGFGKAYPPRNGHAYYCCRAPLTLPAKRSWLDKLVAAWRPKVSNEPTSPHCACREPIYTSPLEGAVVTQGSPLVSRAEISLPGAGGVF